MRRPPRNIALIHGDERYTLLSGEPREVLRGIRSSTVDCCITALPRFVLQGERATESYLNKRTPWTIVRRYRDSILLTFNQVRRVLKPNGTCFVMIDETYIHRQQLGVPWRIAVALQQAGWLLRGEVIWHSPQVIPEKALHRFMRTHHFVFFLSKEVDHYFDAEAIREPISDTKYPPKRSSRMRRSVWQVELSSDERRLAGIIPSAVADILAVAGAPPGGIVLDPFVRSGSVGIAVLRNGRKFVGIAEGHEDFERASTQIEDALSGEGGDHDGEALDAR